MMAGSSIDVGLEITSPYNGVRTLLLVGRTGNGKSATGNTILGRRAFKSRASSSGVTRTCELQQTVLPDGQIVNVIDTPGLFDISAGIEFVGKEFIKCIDLAKDGIHAVLVVFSVTTRFSEEEEAALHSLRTLFGNKIINYVIVVFTGGDELEANDETLDDYLARECPQPLKDILVLCGNRQVLFDNKTKDKDKRTAQVQQLLSLVNTVVGQNDGKPFTDDIFEEMRKGARELHEQQERVGSLKREALKIEENMEKSYDEQLKQVTDMAEAQLRETTTWHEQRLAEEQTARMRAAEQAHMAQMKSNDEIHSLRESLERARKENAEAKLRETTTRHEQGLAKEQAARTRAAEQARMPQMKSNDEIRSLRKGLERAGKENAEAKPREMTTRHEQRLAEEQAARMRAEEQAHMALMKSNEKIHSLRESLERARKENLAEAKPRETTTWHEQRLAEEQATRTRVAEQAHMDKINLNDVTRSLREILERAGKEIAGAKPGETTTRHEQRLAKEQAPRTKAAGQASMAKIESNDETTSLWEILESAGKEVVIHKKINNTYCAIL